MAYNKIAYKKAASKFAIENEVRTWKWWSNVKRRKTELVSLDANVWNYIWWFFSEF